MDERYERDRVERGQQRHRNSGILPMKRLTLAILLLICTAAAAIAQNVTVIGPVTPGDIPQFNSPTVIKDSGFSAVNTVNCVPPSAGTIAYWNGSAWTCFPGNNSGTQVLTENPSGVPAWASTGLTMLTGNVLAKTSAYAPVTGDCGDTITLAGSAQYTLTLNAASGYASNCGFLITNVITETRTKTIAPNGQTSFFLYPGQSVVISNQSNTWSIGPVAGRWRLASPATFYIRPDGSDSNDGLANSSSGAFLTANAALAAVAQNVDINNRTDLAVVHTCGSPPCTITAAAQLVNLVNGIKFTGGVPTYQGDCTTPSNVVLSPSSSVQADIQVTYAPTALNICGFKLSGGGNVNFCSYTSGGAIVRFTGPMIWDVCSAASQNAQIVVASNASVFVLANYTISGNSTAHAFIFHQGQLEFANGLTVTCSGVTAFTGFVVVSTLAQLTHEAATFSGCGSVTGARFIIQTNGVVDTGGGGVNYFPGNVAGTTATGGQYL
jgi:hypothetical protein